MQEFNNKENEVSGNNINAIAGLHYKIINGLSVIAGYQYESGNSISTNLFNEQTYYVRNLINYSTSINNNVITIGIPKGSIFKENIGRFNSHTLRGQLRFDNDFGGDKHSVAALAGTEVREVGNKISSQTKYGYNPQSLQFARVNYTSTYTDIRGAQKLIPDETIFLDNLNRFVSLFSNVGYTYNDKYTVNASARLDKTNLFGSSNKYRNVWLWSAGASWQIHKERFFNSPIINSLILRSTYGINGNVDRSTSPFLIANVATDFQTNQPFAYVSNPENPLLRWEKTTVTNLGIDFRMWKNRLKGSLEFYNRLSSDLLGNSTINGTYGFNSAFINYASMRNTGTDLRLSGLLIDKAFKWNTTLNYSFNKNEVKKVDFPQNTVGAYLQSIPQAGKPLDYLFSYEWAGLSASGAPQVFDDNKDAVTYTTEITNPVALVYEGTAVPPHYGALINEFSYKGFSVLMNFTFKMGHKFRIPVIQYAPLFDYATQVHKDWDSRWKQPGDEHTTNTPAAPHSFTGLNIYDQYTKYANINVATASHIRFRELLINYALPSNMFSSNKVADASIGLQVRNLAVYKLNKEKLDPEFLTQDRNTISLPPQPEFSLFIRINY